MRVEKRIAKIMINTRGYREDIDWLRAIAVLSVIAFHWEVPPFRGGYVGVDFFFVISGYLITQIIQDEAAAGTFSFVKFYERRIRRLLPALYAMVALTAIPCAHFLLLSERRDFLHSIIAVVTFTSNIFFWSQTGYFDYDADEKPLLHTWSLAVEEQFYLVLPLLIFVVLRVSRGRQWQSIVLAGALLVAALASFSYSVWLVRSGHAASAFFLSPQRAWEFLIGSILSVKGAPALRDIRLQIVARLLGLALIIIPVVSYRQNSPFPGWFALWPCLGAAIFIWAGVAGPLPVSKPFSPLGIAAFVGRISYPMYLWHWPLFTLAKFFNNGASLSVRGKLALLIATLILSSLSYLWIERPFRQRLVFKATRSIYAAAAVASLALICVPVALQWGMTQPDSPRALKLAAYSRYSPGEAFRTGTCFVEFWELFAPAKCLTPAAGKSNILLWGDSFAAHYLYGLNRAIDPAAVNLMQATVSNCYPTFDVIPKLKHPCQKLEDLLGEFLPGNRPDLVIIAGDWLAYVSDYGFEKVAEGLKHTVAKLKSMGIPVALIGPSLQFTGRLPSLMMRAEIRQQGSFVANDFVRPDVFPLEARMRAALAGEPGLVYISNLDLTCPEGRCIATIADDIPMIADSAHLTREGSDFVAAKIASALKLPRNPSYSPVH